MEQTIEIQGKQLTATEIIAAYHRQFIGGMSIGIALAALVGVLWWEHGSAKRFAKGC